MILRACIAFALLLGCVPVDGFRLRQANGQSGVLEDYPHQRMPVTQARSTPRLAQLSPQVQQVDPFSSPPVFPPPSGIPNPSPGPFVPPTYGGGAQPFYPNPTPQPTGDLPMLSPLGTDSPFGQQPSSPYSQSDFNAEPIDADLIVNTPRSAQTSYYGIGANYNTDAGLFGQVIIEERDFDWRAAPWLNPPQAWRGGGQRLRIEAMPGSEAQRYLVSFTEPFFCNFGGRPVSFNISGFYFDREYFDWDERRYGGRIKLGYHLSRQLSLQAKFRAESVEVDNPRTLVPELQQSLGEHELFGAGLSLAYDTRDTPYFPTEGGYLSIGAEQVFGSFDYTRGTVNYKRYAWTRQRPDRSGRHVLGLQFDGGITGSQTPIYENFFAGGFSTLRGFGFRHASPKENGVVVGGELSLLGTGEYFFPITADDMVRGLFFVDGGAISSSTSIDDDDFHLSVGGGIRVKVPALGPAPLAVDLAVPLIRQSGDRVQNISLFLNLGF